VGLFGAGWPAGFILPEMKWITSLIGVGLIFSMAQVYRLHTMPAWDTWRTTAGFFVTAALLGHAAVLNLFGAKSVGFVILALLAVELAMMLSAQTKARWTVASLRVGLSAAAMLWAGILLFASNRFGVWISPVLFLLILAEEIIWRVDFYTALEEKPLR